MYATIRRLMPDWLVRLAKRLLPGKMVVNVRRHGVSFKYAMQPGEGGDFKMLLGHEDAAKKAIVDRVSSGDTVVDVGAHRGLYTMLLSRLVGDEGRVHAFEPHPDNIPRLEENLALNDMRNVVLNHAAVGAENGTARFNFGNSSTVASLKSLESQRQDWHEVRCVTLDRYLQDSGADGVRLVKIDVEGAEDLVISGLRGTLERDRPVLLLEFHQFAFTPETAREFFAPLFGEHRYRARLIERRQLGGGDEAATDATESAPDYETLAGWIAGSHTVELLLEPAT